MVRFCVIRQVTFVDSERWRRDDRCWRFGC